MGFLLGSFPTQVGLCDRWWRATQKTVKKTRNGNLLVNVDSQRQAEIILKMKTFHTMKCRAYPHEKLNTSKGVIWSKELVLATEEEIASALGKQVATNIRRISIRKGEEQIPTNSYILTFNQLRTHKEVKISYYPERVKQYVPVPLECFKCQKYGHHREACRERQTCAKCSEKDLEHMEEKSLKEIRDANCQQDHPACARSCNVYKKRKGNTWGETQEECVFPGSKENYRELQGRKQLHLCCSEGG